ncbi:RNA polymerase sigma factor (sigma-70 family) [Salirhabdus euzebyi]|uniref:RNA polymerase sigma factor (Sigma-70 family) n=2 Tax=Salirhabdus euzebyi TaxID=394506 RepID=A0A841QA30_9BACI|nr:RNA polymerase sigma factor (sigma-70 family) [Salirhabdus euzebyi]
MVDALPSYESQGFKTWLSRIAFNTAIDSYRKKRRRKEELRTFDEPILHIENEASAENTMLKNDQVEKIQQAIHSMPKNYREVVYGYYIHHKSYAELAIELDLAEKTVEMRLYRARKWMRENWKEEDF